MAFPKRDCPARPAARLTTRRTPGPPCAILYVGAFSRGRALLFTMHLLNQHQWELVASLFVLAALAVLAALFVFRKRPTPEELEQRRRHFLTQSGRLVDGMLLDIFEIESIPRSKKEPVRTLTMLAYSYHIGGVDYQCAQDITGMEDSVDPTQVRAGFPCSARYQPGNPQNSIVVAEEWSGLRMGLPAQHVYDNPDPIDMSHLRPGRG